MDIKNWKEHPKGSGTEGETGRQKDSRNSEVDLSDCGNTGVCSSGGTHVVPDCDHAGKFNGTDNFCR